MDTKTHQQSPSIRPLTSPRLALALCLLIALVASLGLTACSGDQEEAKPEAPVEPGLEALGAALEQQHAALHSPPAAYSPGDPLPPKLVAAIERSEGDLDLRRRLHKAIGPCQIICDGYLTPLAFSILQRLKDLDKHGIDKDDYDVGFIKAEIDTWQIKTGVSELVKDGGLKKTVAMALMNPKLDKQGLLQTISSAEPRPTPQDIEGLARDIAAIRAKGKELEGDSATLEVAMVKTLLQLVLDFKILQKVGPYEVTPKRKKRTRRERWLVKREEDITSLMTSVTRSDQPYTALVALEPKDPQYAPMLEVYARYKGLADKGGCKELPKGWTFLKGVAPGSSVKKLQERLRCEGYYNYEPDEMYNESTIEAVKAYQRDHNLEETGYVDKSTLSSLNVSMGLRLSAIKITLQRMRERPTSDMGETYIRVNLPAMELAFIQSGQVLRRHKVIIGSNKLDDNKQKLIQGHINRTPLLKTQLYEIHVNPDWILPERVSKGEMVGAIKKNPNYMKDNNIRKTTLSNGREVYVQGPGEHNVLGKVKFLLTESKSIFLHDTNDPWLFTKRIRTFSHGCMRVDEATKFAEWLLERDEQDMDEVKKAYKAEYKQWGFRLNKPLPLISVYRTVEVDESGRPIFYSDVYRYDREVRQKRLPVEERVRWGATQLRPRWVPQIPAEKVEAWRRQGKSAPRDLKP